MLITFHIQYETSWGEKFFITGSPPELGSNNVEAAKELTYTKDDGWQITINFRFITTEFDYRYVLIDSNGTPKVEKNIRHWTPIKTDFRKEDELDVGSLYVSKYEKNRITKKNTALIDTLLNSYTEFHLYDSWLYGVIDRTFSTAAFSGNIFKRNTKTDVEKATPLTNNNLTIRLFAPQIRPDQDIAITGNQDFLGNWIPEQAVKMQDTDFPSWNISLNTKKIAFPLEYKFIITDKKNPDTFIWEEGENRIFNAARSHRKFHITINEPPLRVTYKTFKAAGAVIPVFSLRSKNSFGIGDFGDLKLFIDWAEKTGLHFVQVLPINDTTHSNTWKDSYPYSAISIYALHPLYVNLKMSGELSSSKNKKYEEIRKILNAKETVDYEEVAKYKLNYLQDYYNHNKAEITADENFIDFCKANEDWLLPYAVFSENMKTFHTSDFSKWGYKPTDLKKSIDFLHRKNELDKEHLTFTYFVQFVLFKQFKEISDYAKSKKIVLKGDLPIGINRASVESWYERRLFNMDEQTGAPPDDFSETGQNWSFPTYDWDYMKKTGFLWWQKRFYKLSNLFDCMRIDHILGFFRIWEIPTDYVQGLCGHFNPALPLSKEDIKNYGLTFDKRWTVPCVRSENFKELFGIFANEARKKYLEFFEGSYYKLNRTSSSQTKILKLFENQKDEKSKLIFSGLMTVSNEVLFIEDPYKEGAYHPRISAKNSYVYKELTENQQKAFDRLYNDFFYIRHNDFWKRTALERLTPLINSTKMLICGEDLGMIPDSVHEVMEDLNIFSLELGRISKSGDCEFTDLSKTPYYSVCTTSTHDMNPVRAWWKESAEKTQRYYNDILGMVGKAPEECTSEIATKIIENHLNASSMLTIIPLQDWFSIDDNIKLPDESQERINVPANPENYWRYRMHITLEELLKASEFNKRIASMIKKSGR